MWPGMKSRRPCGGGLGSGVGSPSCFSSWVSITTLGSTSGSEFCCSGTAAQRDPGRGRGLPCAQPNRTRGLGPAIPAGACRQPSGGSERRGLGLGRAEGALKGPKSTQNGSGQLPGCVHTGSTPLLYVWGPRGHERRPIGARVTPRASVCGPFGPIRGLIAMVMTQG